MDGGVEKEKEKERGGGKELGFDVEKLVIKEVPTSRRGGASPKILFLLLPASRSHRRPPPSPERLRVLIINLRPLICPLTPRRCLRTGVAAPRSVCVKSRSELCVKERLELELREIRLCFLSDKNSLGSCGQTRSARSPCARVRVLRTGRGGGGGANSWARAALPNHRAGGERALTHRGARARTGGGGLML